MDLIKPDLLFSQIGAPLSLEKSNPSEQLFVAQKHKFSSDSNPGTPDLPLKTIMGAIEIAKKSHRNGLGTKIRVSPGVYREAISLLVPEVEPAADPVIIIEGTAWGKVKISGSQIWENWQKTNKPGVYVHAWPYKWGVSPFPGNWPTRLNRSPILRRQEMVFVNKLPLMQVLTSTDLRKGTFYVSEVEGKIYVSPRIGQKIETATVEVSVLPKLLTVRGKKNLVIRNLFFENAASPFHGSAVSFFNVQNLLLEDNAFRWNNWAGYQLVQVKNVTSRRNASNYNGGAGIQGSKIKSLLSESEFTSYNNWRGSRGGLSFWAVAGAKYLHLHKAIFRRQLGLSNHTGGFWLDTDNEDILIENSRWCGNHEYGLFIEASQGPIRVLNSKVYNNKWVGVRVMTSENVTLEGNQIFQNLGAEISVADALTRNVKNWETGGNIFLKTGNWKMRHNIISGQNLLLSIGVKNFITTLSSNNNFWYSSSFKKPFMLESNTSPRQFFDFNQWKADFGHDVNSLIDQSGNAKVPAFPNCSHALIPFWANDTPF